MTKLTKEYLRPVFKTSREKLKNFFNQNHEWSKYLGREIDFSTFEVLKAEFSAWKKANKKKIPGRPKGSKDSYKRQSRKGLKLGRPPKK
jgi:hypothetical protein